MAGGEGTRLRPLTCDRPKPMVPIMNLPIMEHIVNLLNKHQLKDIGATLQYLPEAIQAYFEDGSRWGARMHYFIEEVPLGTAGSVKNAEKFLDGTFLVISGDALTDIDLRSAIEFHKKRQAIATLVLTPVETPLEYGVVITDTDGRITQFLEKPSWGEVFSDRVNTGIYILEPEVLGYFKPGQNFDFSKDLFPLLLKARKPLYGYVASGYWCDVGNLNQYRQAHYDALEGRVSLQLPGRSVGDSIWIGSGTEVHPEARLQGPLLIGDHCQIGPGAEIEGLSVIGNHSLIDTQASIKRSISWDRCRVGKKAELRGVVLARRVQVQDNSSAFEGAVIGDDSVIGKRCCIKPGTKIWPNKRVEDGSMLSTSLIWGNCGQRSLFGNRGISGLANIDLTPDLVSRIGGAFGNWLGSGSVAVGGDGLPVSQALKVGVTAGLLAAGIDVVDLGTQISPVFRHTVRSLGMAGGIHIRLSEPDPGKVALILLNSKGSELSRGDERKIESLLAREDIRYAEVDRVGSVSAGEPVVPGYLEGLWSSIDCSQIRRRRFKLVLSLPTAYLSSLVVPLLAETGCSLSTLDYEPDQSELRSGAKYQQKLLSYLSQMVVAQKGDLGILLDPQAERLTLIDDRGGVVDQENLTVLEAMLVLSTHERGAVAVPVSAPRVIEDIAQRFRGRVIRTKTSHTAILEKLQSDEVLQHQGTINQFRLYSDGIATLVFLLGYLAEHGTSLSRLLSEVPAFYTSQRLIDCPWGAKGRVIRSIIEEQGEQPLELLEGVKVTHPDGWALVLPDSEEPVCRIYSEGFSQEIAESLTDWYSERVKEIGALYSGQPTQPES